MFMTFGAVFFKKPEVFVVRFVPQINDQVAIKNATFVLWKNTLTSSVLIGSENYYFLVCLNWELLHRRAILMDIQIYV